MESPEVGCPEVPLARQGRAVKVVQVVTVATAAKEAKAVRVERRAIRLRSAPEARESVVAVCSQGSDS